MRAPGRQNGCDAGSVMELVPVHTYRCSARFTASFCCELRLPCFNKHKHGFDGCAIVRQQQEWNETAANAGRREKFLLRQTHEWFPNFTRRSGSAKVTAKRRAAGAKVVYGNHGGIPPHNKNAQRKAARPYKLLARIVWIRGNSPNQHAIALLYGNRCGRRLSLVQLLIGRHTGNHQDQHRRCRP